MDIRNLSRKDQIIIFEHLINLERKRSVSSSAAHNARVNLDKAKEPIPKPSLLLYIIITPILAVITPVYLSTLFEGSYSLGWYPAIAVLILGGLLCAKSFYKYNNEKQKLEEERANKIGLWEFDKSSSEKNLSDINKELANYRSKYAIPGDCCSQHAFEFVLDNLKRTNLPINQIFNEYSKLRIQNEIKSQIMDAIDEAKEAQKVADFKAEIENSRRKAHEEETRRILTEIRDTQNNIDRYNRHGY